MDTPRARWASSRAGRRADHREVPSPVIARRRPAAPHALRRRERDDRRGARHDARWPGALRPRDDRGLSLPGGAARSADPDAQRRVAAGRRRHRGDQRRRRGRAARVLPAASGDPHGDGARRWPLGEVSADRRADDATGEGARRLPYRAPRGLAHAGTAGRVRPRRGRRRAGPPPAGAAAASRSGDGGRGPQRGPRHHRAGEHLRPARRDPAMGVGAGRGRERRGGRGARRCVDRLAVDGPARGRVRPAARRRRPLLDARHARG
ncbi:MAG: hypothetical protein JWN65_967 [Solirubrobacterales bacterium]|nr:hypothetical protein [Solirubrobacterales bacterium]